MVEAFFSWGVTAVLVSAALMAYVARRLKQPSLVLYIIAGIGLGPVGASVLSSLGLSSGTSIVQEGAHISLMSELGLALLLFLIGMEMKIENIREVLDETFAVSVSQMAGIAVLTYFVMSYIGFSTMEAFTMAIAFMYSSTAVVVKVLSDEGEVGTKAGKLDVSMLLFEDIVVILWMAIIISFGSSGGLSPAGIAWEAVQVIFFVLVIAGTAIGSSKYLLPEFMRFVSRESHAFLIHGLAWMFLFVVISQEIGLSLEMGAFFAGVAIAQLPYSSELHGNIKPLSDLFLAIFFISLGLELTVNQLNSMFLLAVGISAGIIVTKFILYYFLTSRLGFTNFNSFKASIYMVQTSTFSIIFAQTAKSQGLVGSDIVGLVTLIALITMGVSTYLIHFSNGIYKRFMGELPSGTEKESEDKAVVVGYEEGLEDVINLLADKFEEVVVVSDRIEDRNQVKNLDAEFVFGSFRHEDVRSEEDLNRGEFYLSVSEDPELSMETVIESPENAVTAVRAMGDDHAEMLEENGANLTFQISELSEKQVLNAVRRVFDE